jgi:RNA polymerase sigma-70 factor (ECF subfamily)
MSDDQPFAEFIRRIRCGDAEAAAELIRQYEPAVRLEVRMRLTDPRLRRQFDSLDVCQSVLASFFVRAASGQYDLNDPGQLVRLLVGIARNKVAFQARRSHAQRRDQRRQVALDGSDLGLAAAEPSPSRMASGRELLDEFRRRLTEEERRLADLRGEGYAWDEVAARVGGTPQARRKQLARAVARVAQELELDG